MKSQTKNMSLEKALMAFRHSMTSALVIEAKEKGFSLSHFEVLKFIVQEGDPSMKAIARRLHITPPSASSLIDSLVVKDLVFRNRSPEDRRTIRVMLAPKAHVLLVSIHKHKDSIFNHMLSRLSIEDKNELARILTKCIN
jgi:DNA-binding MarR family transcriptional regulator